MVIQAKSTPEIASPDPIDRLLPASNAPSFSPGGSFEQLAFAAELKNAAGIAVQDWVNQFDGVTERQPVLLDRFGQRQSDAPSCEQGVPKDWFDGDVFAAKGRSLLTGAVTICFLK